MSTYSVYDIKIDNSLAFTSGPTAGWVLAIDANGDSYWADPASGAQGPTGPTGPDGATGSSPTDNKTFITLTDAATISWTYSNGYNAKVTLGGDRALSISGATNGDYGTLIVTQDATGGREITFGANDKFASGTYSFSTTGTASDIYTWVYDGTDYYWNYNKDFS